MIIKNLRAGRRLLALVAFATVGAKRVAVNVASPGTADEVSRIKYWVRDHIRHDGSSS